MCRKNQINAAALLGFGAGLLLGLLVESQLLVLVVGGWYGGDMWGSCPPAGQMLSIIGPSLNRI